MGREYKLKYVDVSPIYFPYLTHYPGGLTLPGKDNIIKVTEKERKHLLMRKNGKNPCYVDYRERQHEEKEE